MKKLGLSVLAGLALWGMTAACRAAEGDMKPVVTVSFSGYERLLSNIGMIGQLGGNPNLDQGVEMLLKLMTGGRGVDGLDVTQPWGVVLLTDGRQRFTTYGYVPVIDVKKLLDLVSSQMKQRNPQIGKLEDHDGVYKLTVAAAPPGAGPLADTVVFVTQKGPWAVVTAHAEDFVYAPQDPTRLWGDLPDRYDLAVQCAIKNIPPQFREYVLAQLQAGAQAGLEQLANSDSPAAALQADLAKRAMQQATLMIQELDDVVLGWKVDQNRKTMYLDLDVVAQPDTELARQFAKKKGGKTDLAGFFAPAAGGSGRWLGLLSDANVVQAKAVLAELRKQGAVRIEAQDWPDEQKKLAARLLADVLDVVEKTIAAQKIDCAVAAYCRPDAVTVVGGVKIADGDKLNNVIARLASELSKEEPAVREMFKLNVETCEGVRLHVLNVPLEDARMARFFGDPLEVIVGIGRDKLTVAYGRDALKTLKEALTKSKTLADQEVPPLQASLAIGAIMGFTANLSEDGPDKMQQAALAQILAAAKGKDRVTLTSSSVLNGVRIRLEVEEGLLALLGMLGRTAAPPTGK